MRSTLCAAVLAVSVGRRVHAHRCMLLAGEESFSVAFAFWAVASDQLANTIESATSGLGFGTHGEETQ